MGCRAFRVSSCPWKDPGGRCPWPRLQEFRGSSSGGTLGFPPRSLSTSLRFAAGWGDAWQASEKVVAQYCVHNAVLRLQDRQ